MLQYDLAPIQRSQKPPVHGNTLLQRVRVGAQIALAGEGRGLLQKQEHFTQEFAAESTPSLLGEDSQQSKRGDRLNQKCLFCSNGSRASKAAGAVKSATGVKAETLRDSTILTRLSGLRQTLHERRHQPARHPEVDRSCTVWLTELVSISSYAACDIADIPREKSVNPTVIVGNVMMGLMWPFS